MSKKVISIGIAIICFIIFTQEIKAEASKILKRDTIIQGITFPKGTEAQFKRNGDLFSVRLSEDINIQGIFCAKAPEVVCFQDGSNKIAHATLAQEQVIEGIPCGKGFIFFYKSGKLQSANLAHDQEIQGVKFFDGSYISFYESSKLKKALLGQEQEIEGRLYNKGDTVKFDKGGRLL